MHQLEQLASHMLGAANGKASTKTRETILLPKVGGQTSTHLLGLNQGLSGTPICYVDFLRSVSDESNGTLEVA